MPAIRCSCFQPRFFNLTVHTMKKTIRKTSLFNFFATIATLLFTLNTHAAETPSNASGSNSQTFGDYTVYYSLFNSTFLQPDVAGAANIVRGDDRAVVNISIRKKNSNASDAAVTATVSGVSNDMMRDFPMSFAEIKEPGAIYYLAQFEHFNEETRNFTITVKVADQNEPMVIKFSQKLWHHQ
jgi:hypothetical protein